MPLYYIIHPRLPLSQHFSLSLQSCLEWMCFRFCLGQLYWACQQWKRNICLFCCYPESYLTLQLQTPVWTIRSLTRLCIKSSVTFNNGHRAWTITKIFSPSARGCRLNNCIFVKGDTMLSAFKKKWGQGSAWRQLGCMFSHMVSLTTGIASGHHGNNAS